MSKRVFVAKSTDELEHCYIVIQELRPHLSKKDFFVIYNEAHNKDGYEIVAIEENNIVVAVMGYRILADFVRGRHVYVDDLVASEAARSRGLGAELLSYAEGVSRKSDCTSLRLCAGLDNRRAIQFYIRNGWTKRAYALSKKI
jgi:ribosomal protein S18 acetylase RimI-like enzyme